MAIMKHESIKPSQPVEGMRNGWVTIRVVDNDFYQRIMKGLDKKNHTDNDVYVPISEFNQNPYQAIEKAINEQIQSGIVLFTKEMVRTSTCGQQQTSVSFDIYLATYIVEIQFPASTVDFAKKHRDTVYENAFVLPQGSPIHSDQIKRLLLDVLRLERHVLLYADKPTKELERHEIALFKENDTWFYLLSGDEQAHELPNTFLQAYDRSLHELLNAHRNQLITHTPPWRDLCDEKYGSLYSIIRLEVFHLMAAAGHIPKDFGLDHHFPLELDWNYDPTNLAMTLTQGTMQPESNFAKFPTDLIKRIFAESLDKQPEQISAYMNTLSENVKTIYNSSITPQLICEGRWGKTPSISISCPNDPTLIDKFYQSGLLSFNNLFHLDPKSNKVMVRSSTGPGDCGVYLANGGRELAIAFASQEERDNWAALMGLQHDYYNQGVGIWPDHPQCIYFTNRFFQMQQVKQYIQEKSKEEEAIVLNLAEAKTQSSILTTLSMFVNQLAHGVTQEMKSNLKCCHEQILAAKLLIEVLNNHSDVETLVEKYPSYVSIIEHDEVLHDIWSQIEKNTSPKPM